MNAAQRRRRVTVAAATGAVVLAAGVLAVGIQLHFHDRASTIHISSRSAALSATTAPTATGVAASDDLPGPVVVAIGDSIMDGHNVKSSHAWPELIGAATNWQLTDLASDGTGFVAVGDEGDTFQDQAEEAVSLDPSIVILAASSNDLDEDPTDVAEATLDTMRYLRDELPDAHIIALNTFWGDTTPPFELEALDSDIQQAAAVIGADYLDIGQPLEGQPGLMQFDDVHPTERGLTVLAAAVAAAIRADT